MPSMPRGFSLMELMLSMALGLMVCALMLPVLQATLLSQRFALERLDAQQEARFVLQQLGQDLRMAGSFGCAGPGQWPVGQGPALPLATADTLELVYAGSAVAVLAESIEPGATRLRLLQTPPAWRDGQRLLLSSCTHVDVLVLGQQAWLEEQGGSIWLRLDRHSPAALRLAQHHLLSLELQALEARQYRLEAQSLWLRRGEASAQLLARGIASLQWRAEPLSACVAGHQPWWWTVTLGMRAGRGETILPGYAMQLASRMGMPCPA